ncbi:MAG: hypothetical protein U0360_08515 [Dehalococcoidia bacterium]
MIEPRDEPTRDEPTRDAPEGETVHAGDLLRQALVNDDDPRFPWWLPLPGLGLAVLWAG